MGKTKKMDTPKNDVKKQDVTRKETTKFTKPVEMPKSSKDVTALQLTADQANVVKKQCQKLYGHQINKKEALKQIDMQIKAKLLQARQNKKAQANAK